MITTYTFGYDSLQNRIIIDKCFVTLPTERPDARPLEHKALCDTGAMSTCISEKLAADMGLIATDYISVSGANNVPFQVPLYDVQIKLGDFIVPFKRVICRPMGDDYDMIIGMDIITMGDLAITNYEGKTVMSFRTPSLERIDFAEDYRVLNGMPPHDRAMPYHELSPSYPVVAGSGKVPFNLPSTINTISFFSII